MARLHSKRRGKSGTKRPKNTASPKWVNLKPAEVKELILKMVGEGVLSSKIAVILRDEHGIPSVRGVLGVSLTAFLKKENALPEYPEDFLNLIKRAIRIRNHLKKNKKDVRNNVKLLHVESKVLRLVKYYTKIGKLPKNWKYDPEKAVLLVK